VSVYPHSFFVAGSENTCITGRSRSLTLVRIESDYAMQLSISPSRYPWSYLASFQRYCRFSAQKLTQTHTIQPEFWECSRWTRSPMLGFARARTNQPCYYFQCIPTYAISSIQRYRRTNGRTEVQVNVTVVSVVT